MLNNSPVIRGGIYVLAVLASIAAIVLGPISPQWAEAIGNVSVYLGGLAGITAATNLTAGPDPRLLDPKP